ncbi:PilZ domain-containing protein [Erythrobacter sp. GH1-10]|uniref:PilZ domain-containing protein n=1 Tax=Erythrobacter sp. GH1-10 TaxID=3349334 RepID=UPI00387813F9
MAGSKSGTELKAVVRYRTRSKMEMPVLDLSAGGCMVSSRGWSAKPDESVSVKLPGLGFIPAKVVWIEDQRAGIAFEEALYGPTLEHLMG